MESSQQRDAWLDAMARDRGLRPPPTSSTEKLKALPDGTGDSKQLTAQLFSSTKRIGLVEADNLIIKWLFESETQENEITS